MEEQKGFFHSVLDFLGRTLDPPKHKKFGPLIGPVSVPGLGENVFIRQPSADGQKVVIRLVNKRPKLGSFEDMPIIPADVSPIIEATNSFTSPVIAAESKWSHAHLPSPSFTFPTSGKGSFYSRPPPPPTYHFPPMPVSPFAQNFLPSDAKLTYPYAASLKKLVNASDEQLPSAMRQWPPGYHHATLPQAYHQAAAVYPPSAATKPVTEEVRSAPDYLNDFHASESSSSSSAGGGQNQTKMSNNQFPVETKRSNRESMSSHYSSRSRDGKRGGQDVWKPRGRLLSNVSPTESDGGIHVVKAPDLKSMRPSVKIPENSTREDNAEWKMVDRVNETTSSAVSEEKWHQEEPSKKKRKTNSDAEQERLLRLDTNDDEATSVIPLIAEFNSSSEDSTKQQQQNVTSAEDHRHSWSKPDRAKTNSRWLRLEGNESNSFANSSRVNKSEWYVRPTRVVDGVQFPSRMRMRKVLKEVRNITRRSDVDVVDSADNKNEKNNNTTSDSKTMTVPVEATTMRRHRVFLPTPRDDK